MDDRSEITALLIAHRDGDEQALTSLIPLLYEDLRRIAHSHARSTSSRFLDTTSLIHEAYLRIAEGSPNDWNDRNHFLSVCARAMRQIVISRARRRVAAKRGGGIHEVAWTDDLPVAREPDEHLIDIERALDRLQRMDDRLVRVVECRYFAGYTEQQTAEALAVSLRTVQRDWLRAKAWLRMDLGSDFANGGGSR